MNPEYRNRLLAAWMIITALFGGYLVLQGLFAASTLFGTPPTTGNLVDSSSLFMSSGLVFAAGPLVVWYFRRGRGWLIAAAATFGLLEVAALLIVISA